MASSREHYDTHLGPVYSWMAGDPEAAISRNREELRTLGILPGATRVAVDLGAGPGLYSVPLAQLGFSVLAIDNCASLVEELRGRIGRLPIRAVADDLLGFRAQLLQSVDAIICMGDTLTHLPSREAVDALLKEAAEALSENGVFVTTFRDYFTKTLTGAQRFIKVRSDETRILTCFLEYGPQIVTVHDLLHERTDAGWQLHASSYPKLRLGAGWVADRLGTLRLAVQQDVTPGGMIRIVARRR
jgi:SAM-dependent methyltransferase